MKANLLTNCKLCAILSSRGEENGASKNNRIFTMS